MCMEVFRTITSFALYNMKINLAVCIMSGMKIIYYLFCLYFLVIAGCPATTVQCGICQVILSVSKRKCSIKSILSMTISGVTSVVP